MRCKPWRPSPFQSQVRHTSLSEISWNNRNFKERRSRTTTMLELMRLLVKDLPYSSLLSVILEPLRKRKTSNTLKWAKLPSISPWCFKSKRMSSKIESLSLLRETITVLEPSLDWLTTWSSRLKFRLIRKVLTSSSSKWAKITPSMPFQRPLILTLKVMECHSSQLRVNSLTSSINCLEICKLSPRK